MARTLKQLFESRPCPIVKRSVQTYLVSMGWEFKRGSRPHWEGHYKTGNAAFPGWIEKAFRPRFYILNPPEGFKRAYPSNVIGQQGQGWHEVRFCKQPHDVDSGVLEIERLLRVTF
jgi:hypothetical protein